MSKNVKKRIPKLELRIAKSSRFNNKEIKIFFHVKCIFESFTKARKQTVLLHVIVKLRVSIKSKALINALISKVKPIVEKSDPKPLKKQAILDFVAVTKKSKSICLKQPSIKIMYSNADQLTHSKIGELKTKINSEKPLVVALCEVKQKRKAEYKTSEFQIDGYEMYNINVESDVGRGIIVYIKSEINSSILQINTTLEEAVVLEIKLKEGTLLFCCMYRSPTTQNTNYIQNTENINSFLKNVATNKKYSHRCIVGDFNYKDIDWGNWNTNKSRSSHEEKFLNTLRDAYLHQHVSQPTRKRGTDEPSLLDLVLTDDATQISEISYDSPLGKSDHSTLNFEFNCLIERPTKRETFNYLKGDYESMRNDLEASDWETEMKTYAINASVENYWSKIKDKLYQLRDKYVPKTTKNNAPHWSSKGSVPLDVEARRALKEKEKFFRKWIDSLTNIEKATNRTNYNKARNKVKTLVRKAKRNFEKEIATKSKLNPKPFWAYTNRKLKTTTGVSPLLDDIKDPRSLKHRAIDKANILQKQFTSVFTVEPPGDLPSISKKANTILKNMKVNEKEVKELLDAINPNKSIGPDKLHPRMLKELAKCLSKPITILFNMTLDHGTVPEEWKIGHIFPIFKKGKKQIAENYRPISLTSVLCKIMEKLVRSHVMKHLVDNKLLSPKQFGFITGRSTTTQLLYFIDKCMDIISEGKVLDTIYFDFAKAFDSVPHKRLLHKLKAYGIDGNTLAWITSFLVGRKQFVAVDNVSSEVSSVTSGVPQGTVLGPILFVIYINDLLENVKSDGLLYADDTKIFRCILTKEDAKKLQDDIDTLEAWSKIWLMNFHPGKCHVLTLGKFEAIQLAYKYTICGEEIEHVASEKDLGVTIDEELTFEDHICNKVRIANALVGLIRRSFSYLDGPTFKKLFTAMIRPHLEYGVCVWSPYLAKYIDMIEKVQERATRLINGFSKLEYSERLKKLNLTTLSFRRFRGDLIEVYKHVNKYDQTASTSSSFVHRTRPSRKHQYQLVQSVRGGSRSARGNSFYHRVVKDWNELPCSIVEAKSINAFKNALDNHLKDHPLKYNHRIVTEADE